jgi:hypothetical protein
MASVHKRNLLGNTIKEAVIIYDDLVSVLSANAVLGGGPLQAEEDGKDAEWSARSWQFDMLQPGTLAEQALVAAEGANLLLFTTTGTKATPEWIGRWLERWAASHSQSDTVLGFVLAGETLEEKLHVSETVDFLRQLAECHVLTFRFFREIVSEEDSFTALRHMSCPLEFLPPSPDATSGRRSGGEAWRPVPDWVPGSGSPLRAQQWWLGSTPFAVQKLEAAEA